MFFLKSAFCRLFQTAFRIALPVLPYREPEIINSCAQLPSIIKKENIKSVLIVTDKGIVNNGLVAPLEESLKESGVQYKVYDNTMPNPTVKNVEEALSVYKANNCDCLIAIGGGSSMDCAKAVGARVAYPKRRVGQMKGVMRILRRLPTVIAIPTTAGTGSDTTQYVMLTIDEPSNKRSFRSEVCFPYATYLDTRYTMSLPIEVTRNTAIDALCHAVESYLNTKASSF